MEQKAQVFISWSGEYSQSLGNAFSHWIGKVIQIVKPFYSPDDISKGAFWLSDLTTSLVDTRIGLIFVTPDNVNNPWILFEAGALSKTFGKPCVVPLLFGLGPSDLTGPLSHLNCATFNREEVCKTLLAINAQLDETIRMENQTLEGVFDKWWPDLEQEVAKISSAAGRAQPKLKRREVADMLEEVLEITRRTLDRVSAEAQAAPALSPKPREQRSAAFSARVMQAIYGTDAVLSAMNDLPERMRLLLALCDLEGLTPADTSRATGMSPGSVQLRLGQARSALAKKLLEPGSDTPEALGIISDGDSG